MQQLYTTTGLNESIENKGKEMERAKGFEPSTFTLAR